MRSRGLSHSLSHAAAQSISFSCLPLYSLSLCGNEAGGHEGLPLCSLTAPSLSTRQRKHRRGGDGPDLVEGRGFGGGRLDPVNDIAGGTDGAGCSISPSLSLCSSLYLPHSALSCFRDLVITRAAQTTAASGTLGTSTSEDEYGGEQVEGGARAAFTTSARAGADHAMDALDDGGSRS